MFLVEVETTMNDQVGADKDGTVTFPRAGCGTRGIRLRPGHHLKIKDVDIVKEVRTIPTAKDDHLCAVYEVGWVIEASSGSTTAFGALEPCHGKWVKRMQISEYSLIAFASEDDDSGASKYGRVAVPGRGRRSRYARFDPSWRIHIKYVCIIEVGEAVLFSFVEVTTKDY